MTALQGLSIETFTETFGEQNPKADLNLYLKTAFSIHKLRQELDSPNNKFYFVFYEEFLVGYTKLKETKIHRNLVHYNTLEVERIYVKKEFQGCGIGKYLLEYACNKGRQLHKDYVYLSVWEKNEKALGFYKSQEFIESGKRVFNLGTLPQNDLIMMKKIGK